MECVRSGIGRYWSEEVIGSCDPIPAFEIFLDDIFFILILSLVPFGLLLLLQTISFFLPTNVSLKISFGILHFLWSLGILVANCFFLVSVQPHSQVVMGLGIGFLLFWFFSNAAYSFILSALHLKFTALDTLQRRISYRVGWLLATLDLTLYHIFTLPSEVEGTMSRFRLANAALQFAPLLVLQGISLTSFTTSTTLLCLSLNSLGILLLVLFELGSCIQEVQMRGRGATSRSTKKHSSKAFDLRDFNHSMQDMNAPDDVEGMEEPLPPARPLLFKLFAVLTFPLLLVGLLPQALTVIGLPFCYGCVRRYWRTSSSGDTKVRLHWIQGRGFFLISVNVVSLAFVVSIFLPLASLLGLVLFGAQRVLRLSDPKLRLRAFSDFRLAIHHLLSCLAFSLLPFLTILPPVVKPPISLTEVVLPLWKQGFGVIYYLALELALPIVDIVTDFQFSFQLLETSQDELLTSREVLFGWIIVSFVASGMGLLLDLISRGLEISHMRKNPTLVGLKDYMVGRSPFGDPMLGPSANFLKLLVILFEEVPQILAVCSTISFLGRAGTLWSFKLGLSIFSISYNFSKVFSRLIFGSKLTKRARFALQVLYFILFAIPISLGARFIISDQFCEFDRTVDSPAKLRELGACTEMTGTLLFTNFGQPVDQTFVVEELEASFNLLGNEDDVSFAFLTETLVSNLTVANNRGILDLDLSSLEGLDEEAGLVLANNSYLEEFEVPALFSILEGAVFKFTGNAGPMQLLDLSGLFLMAGELEITENQNLTLVDLSLIFNLDYSSSLVITGNPLLETLELRNLNMINGMFSITSNPRLLSLSLPYLLNVDGMLLIEDNASLLHISFDRFFDGVISLIIESNPSLLSIVFGQLQEFTGDISIVDNQSLTEIDLGAFSWMDERFTLTISGNQQLTSLDFSGFDCDYELNLLVENNPNLQTIYLGENCLADVVSTNNPNLVFVTS